MTQAAKAQEPSMEEILASTRRIIADDDAAKTPKPEPAKLAATPRPAPPPPRAVAPAPAAAPASVASNNQDDIDAMLAGFDAPNEKPAPASVANDILDLTEAMAAPVPPQPAFRAIDSRPDVAFDETPDAPETTGSP